MAVDPTQSSVASQRTSGGTSAGGRATRPARGRRWIWLVVSGACFAVATLAAFRQPPRDNPINPTQTNWQWFTEPVERNSWRRLPAVSSRLSSVFFADKLHGWAVGLGGTILASSDGGANWKPQSSGTSQWLTSVHFADASHGWAVGGGGTILASSDGGANWKRQTSGTSQNLLSVHFADASHGWAVGDGGTILASSDGGANWKRQTSGTSQPLESVHFADASHGWAVGEGSTILASSDGGANWKPQTSGTSRSLISVHFADASHGWAVGLGGTILATSDGGANWKPQTSGTSQWLASVHFADASHGWAVGFEGTILASSDGGATWKPQTSGTSWWLTSVHFADASHGWAVGLGGTILATSDGGATWKPQSSGPSQWLTSVHFADAGHGWAVGGEGTILASSDGGATWKHQTSGTSAVLLSVHFADASHGWAVGDGGTILASSDGGATWKPQSSGTSAVLLSVHFADASHGWAVGDGGTILASSDGGATWKPQSSGPSQWLTSVHFADASHGWAVGDGGTILASSDGGANWKRQTSGTSQNLESVHFADASHGWAVGYGGTILASSDGGANWKRQTSGTSRSLYDVHSADASHGWAVGDGGTILASSDGGANWKPQTSGASQSLRSVHFADASHGWAVGYGGTILASSDGGQVWRTPDPPARYPARWYYVAVFLCLLVALPGLRPEIVVPPADSAANRQVSDNPIGPGDLDALGLGDIALGLSQFFRNVDTKPPLTIGVLGEWGQGKSSVMRLLEADLKKNGVYPVWFNAWHYQKEDHLLAYLLEAIRKQAVPRLQTLQGLRFRARLLGLRTAKGRWTLAVLIMLLAFCSGLLQHPESLGGLTEWAKGVGKLPPDAAGQLTIFGLSVGTALLFLRQIYEALKAFHVNPAALIKEAAGSASIKELGEKTNLRMSFAKEFSDVTRALEPYRMVIFIDDLDRCNPQSVTQILESVNFLTSAGNCFVVMGLAKAQVEASVGLSFKDVAEELGDTADPKKMRRDYAQQYLRKLINLEVKVPTATPEQQRVLLAGQAADEATKPRTYAERLADFGRANRPVAWVAATFLLASASLWYGMNFRLQEPPSPPTPIVVETASAKAKPEPPKTPPPEGKEKPSPENRGPVVFVPGIAEERRLVWLPVFPGLLLLGLGVWVLTRRPNEIIQDSRKFTEALEIWQPVIGRQYKTPREIKRFLNRVRYIAMRWRKPSQQKALFERFVDWVQSKMRRTKTPEAGVAAVAAAEINEAEIVRMATLEGLGGKKPLPDSDIAIGLMKHTERFGRHGDDWQRFYEITGEVEVN
jgi:photosystem II stability/assembly factor-like uncharacterized protein